MAVLAVTGGLPPGARAEPASAPTSIVLIVLDSLRPDRLGVYGNRERPTSPYLDRFARQAVVFERAYASASYTLASVPTLLTGRAPEAHGLIGFERKLNPVIPTAASLLGRAGHRSLVASRSGIFRGFGIEDSFEMRVNDPALAENMKGFRRAWQQALGELVHGKKPYFAYLHFLPPHAPYSPPQGFPLPFTLPDAPGVETGIEFMKAVDAGAIKLDASQRAALLARYDSHIAYADHLFGNAIEFLEEAGALDRCYVVLTSDHGEAFGEHGRWEHNTTVYEEMIRVPLIVRPPGGRREQARISTPVGLIDLLPTWLEWADVTPPEGLPGVPLPLDPARAPPRRSAPLTARATDATFRFALIDGDRKYIRSLNEDGPEELYDLATDPGERRNLARDREDLLKALSAKASEALAAERKTTASLLRNGPIEPAVEQNLRSLGYVR